MAKPSTIYYQIEYDEDSKIYTGYCSSIKPVRFSDRDESKVKELVEDGIDMYLEKHPDFFDSFNSKEV